MRALFKRSAIRSSAFLLLKLAVFVASAYLNILVGYHFLDDFLARPDSLSRFVLYPWGLIFGIVVLVWQVRSIQNAINVSNAAFLFADELIWLLVFTLLVRFAWIVYYPFRSFGVVTAGTAFLTSVHAMFLGASKRRVLLAIPSILGVWFLLSYFAGRFVTNFIMNFLQIPHTAPFLFSNVDSNEIAVELFGVSQTIWQAAYLLCMFSPRQSWLFPFLRSAPNRRTAMRGNA